MPQPDDTRLAVPKAYVALADGWAADADTARAIMEYARDHLAPYLKVRRVEFFELPKTISGKIRRVELRKREDEAHRSGTPIDTEHRYEDLVRRGERSDGKSDAVYDAGPTDVPILEETIGANFERTAASTPGRRGARRRRAGAALDLRASSTPRSTWWHGVCWHCGIAQGRPGRHLGAQLRRVDHRAVRDGQDRRHPGQRQPGLPHPRTGLRAQPVGRADARSSATDVQDLGLRRHGRRGARRGARR